jgi:transcriptional accessory protein Tex/SPT6
MKITSYSEYEAVLKRIVNGAEYLENPMIKPEDYEKGIKLYDQLVELAIEYRRTHADSTD